MQLTTEQRLVMEGYVAGNTTQRELVGVLEQLLDEADQAPSPPQLVEGNMYTVEIVEHIVETRLYDSIGPCENGLEAAREARIAYIDNGVIPDDGPSISVQEREFQVKRLGVTAMVTFDESEVTDA